MTKKKIAVIGAGHLGKIHAKLLSTIENVDPIVVEPSPEARQLVSDSLGIPTAESLNNVDGTLDGAIVVTPTETHCDVATQLLDRGAHLLVEKPLCATVAESKKLCDLAEQHNKTLQVGHVERFNPSFVAAGKSIQNPRYIESVRNTPYTFRATDVSVVQDLMIHDIDLVLSLVNSPVARVSATGTAVIGPHYDMAKAWIEFENGCVASLTASRCSYSPQRSMQVVTESAHVNIDFAQQSVHVVAPQARQLAALRAMTTHEEKMAAKDSMFEKWLPIESVEVTAQNAILEEQLEFVRCIDGAHPTVSGRDGFKAVVVADQVIAELNRSQAIRPLKVA